METLDMNAVDVVFLGDSHTERWPRDGSHSWDKYFSGKKNEQGNSLLAVNLGISADRTEHFLARLQSGNLKPFESRTSTKPVVFVLLIGTNNRNRDECTAQRIAAGIEANARCVLDEVPNSYLLQLYILPGDRYPDDQRAKVREASSIAHDRLAGNPRIRHINVESLFVHESGKIRVDLMPDTLHLSEEGYDRLAQRIEPMISRFLGSFKPSQLVPTIDLRPVFRTRSIAIRQQGRRGACQVFAFASALEWSLLAASGPKEIDLSEQYLMWGANQATNNLRLDGFNPDLLVSGLRAHGVCAESAFPYEAVPSPILQPKPEVIESARTSKRFEFESIKHWTEPIGIDEQTILLVCERLEKRQVLVTTLCWPFGRSDDSIVDPNNFLIDTAIDGTSKDGHGVLIVGYGCSDHILGGGYWIIRNSWGQWFGEQGYAYASFDYAKKYCTDLYRVHLAN